MGRDPCRPTPKGDGALGAFSIWEMLMKQEIDLIPLYSVRINGGTQSRIELNQATISEYTEAIRTFVELPPVIIFFDGSNFWLADGFHRYFAHKSAGAMEIAAEIHEGTNRDAVLYSVGANSSHGLRRTNEDKRRAVMMLLNDSEWAMWSDREIAKQCGVSHPFVAAIRSPEVAVKQQENRESRKAGKSAKVESDSTDTPKVTAETRKSAQSIDTRTDEPSLFIHPPQELAHAAEPASSNEVQALREQLAEIAENMKSTLADNEMMGRVFDSDDQLKAAMDEAKRQKAIAENAERTLASKSGEFIERARAVTHWMNRAQKAEKALAKLEAIK